ncbi:MAG: helix-turn-helix domain-containing protein [Phycisphaerae bacterium]|nr:helix-turn-helix domain-containing protein [Phycisphaerae bacterium]
MSDYLTIGDAAEYLGISKDTLRRWDRAGKLTARRVRWRKSRPTSKPSRRTS